MSKRIRHIFLLAVMASVVSCKKKTPEDIGLPLLPGEDLLNAMFIDTLTLISHTVKDDSLLTKNVSPMLLGNMNDPVFGTAQASFFSQLALSKTNPSFGASPVLDSAVLSLVYSSGQYYGTLYPQKFKVYELSESLYKDSAYFSNRMLPYTTELGSAYLTPNLKDSVSVDSLKYPVHLRIQLDKTFFQEFLTNPTYTASAYSSTAAFQNVFKGLYVTSASLAPSGEGAILYMDLTQSYSRVTLFYHNTTDTASYYFNIPKDATRFSHFEHDYSFATDIKTQLGTAATVQADKIFIQPMGGVRAKISMPHIKDLFKNEKVSINKAELILPVDALSIAGADSIFSPHPKLVATIANDSLGPVIMPDYFEGATYFGGDYDKANKVYKFNIARYVQQVLSGTKNNDGLYIIANARPTSANRVQLMGGNKALSNHMRLKITYTPLE